ncbi:MAG: hypothetical protein A2878_00665 [Candidatus Moranbacteria bacterium RIFCSPHIGHO2_01_FULL_54_31]|nr:MAG: hypothetical protein A2878_00665 [Candidatus Moranbacteria bacterium RIFCSPHIGHO2_01_FULL_54_31]
MSKRVFDVVVSIMLLLFLFPLMLLIAFLVKATSKGPVIFRQERVGLHGTPFTILKFRTMEHGSERPLDMVTYGDTRITKAGRFLRSMHLDELPQLINVFRGEMSIVGPRPFRVCTIQRWCEKIPNFNQRHMARPGMTGPTQIFGRVAVQSAMEQAASFELAYVRKHNFSDDMRIIIKTIPIILKGKGI